MEEPVGEDVAALAVGDHLDLVDREEADFAVHRHRLDRAHEPARVRRHDALLARDQRHLPRSLCGGNALVVLARQQAQRKADHAGAVAEHAFDRKERLAGVGGPENRGDLRIAHDALDSRASSGRFQAMLIAQISDLHIQKGGKPAYGRVDTVSMLRRAVEALNALDPQPDVVLATGDLVERGSAEEYGILKEILAP